MVDDDKKILKEGPLRGPLQENLKGVNNMLSFLVFSILVMTIYILFFK